MKILHKKENISKEAPLLKEERDESTNNQVGETHTHTGKTRVVVTDTQAEVSCAKIT